MIPLALLVILVVLFNKLVGLISKDTISDYLWSAYIFVAPTPSIKKLKETQKKAALVYQERANTSAKEEFAKWAKLDREYLKLTGEVDTLSK